MVVKFVLESSDEPHFRIVIAMDRESTREFVASGAILFDPKQYPLPNGVAVMVCCRTPDGRVTIIHPAPVPCLAVVFGAEEMDGSEDCLVRPLPQLSALVAIHFNAEDPWRLMESARVKLPVTAPFKFVEGHKHLNPPYSQN